MIPIYESYAGALYNAAERLGCTGVVVGELPKMEEVLKQCGFHLNNPLISVEKRVAVLRKTLTNKISPLTLEFLLLMTARRHLKHFHATINKFRQLSGYEDTIVNLRVPFAPERNTLVKLKERLTKEKLIPENAKEAHFNIIEDKELIGGFVASCNGYQIDTSLKTAVMKLLSPERLVHFDD
jgi:F0F1-type ATP synthase delta subunit